MDQICELEKCIGCGLCQNICPKNCINMQYNNEGFIIPVINNKLCINCGLCKKNCIANLSEINSLETKSKYYCASSKDKDIVNSSSSGGIFTELAKYIFQNNGIVYGAVFNKNFLVNHSRATNLHELEFMKYSKYIQSDTSNIYKQVKLDLENNSYVLFTGTPCQVFALKKYLKKDYEKLILVDVLCFGVMSTLVFKDYLNYILENNNIEKEGLSIYFRSKLINNNEPSFLIAQDGKVMYNEFFYKVNKGICYAFRSKLLHRLSCQNCKFQGLNRISDITIGDYSEKNNKIVPFTKSLVLCNTNKGLNVINNCEINKSELIGEDLSFSQNRLVVKTEINYYRKKFFKNYKTKGLNNETIKLMKFKKIPLIIIIKNKLKRILKRK